MATCKPLPVNHDGINYVQILVNYCELNNVFTSDNEDESRDSSED